LYAILDIETTGGKYDEEGITEIAIYQFDAKVGCLSEMILWNKYKKKSLCGQE